MKKIIKPKFIRLEASSICQLKCKLCPNSNGEIKKVVGAGHLKPENFEQLLTKNPFIEIVELSNWGEMFLNPKLDSVIKIASEHDVILIANNGVNLNFVDEKVLETLVKYKFASISCSIDGATNNSYQKYRLNGDIEKIFYNIKLLNYYKKKYKSPYPKMIWKFIVFGHNEHEIPMARKLAAQLNMQFLIRLSWESDFSPIEDEEFVLKETGLSYTSRKEYKDTYGVDYMQDACSQLWTTPQINWDGKLLGCCVNYWGDFGGNVFTDGLLETINSQKINDAREIVTGQTISKPDIPCLNCYIYKGMRDSGNWFNIQSFNAKRAEMMKKLKVEKKV